ncbi:MAG TPA: hypothetical protein VJA21_16150 [Verrucomicrobiae bacterium]
MKTKSLFGILALSSLLGGIVAAAPLGTAFTYQGKLASTGQAANGLFDLRFTVYDASANGSVLGGPVTKTATPVTNGVFAVALDFGGGIFVGDACWLEVGVRATSSGGDFQLLSPRQPLTPVPYSLFAPNAAVANLATTASGVANNSIFGAAIANGQVVRSLNGLTDAVSLAGGANVALATNGNTLQISATGGGTALAGYKENGPFALPPIASGPSAIAQGEHAQALGDHSVVGGGLDNLAGHTLTTIGGGWSNAASGLFFGRTTIGGGEMNQTVGDWATVGGGQLNTAGGPFFGRATVAGGWQNTASGDMSTISGGSQNSATIGHAVIGGGQANVVSNGAYATIGGGSQNAALGGHGVIAGGQSNTITTLQAPWSVIGGGHVNQVSGLAGTIGGGYQNSVSAEGAVVGGGEGNSAGAFAATVAGGNANQAAGYESTVGGGSGNQAAKDYSTVAGGAGNQSRAVSATVSGGYGNVATGQDSVIGGGYLNRADGMRAVTPGGHLNEATGDYSFAAGVGAKANHTGAFVWADSQGPDFLSTRANEVALRALNGIRLQTDVGIHLNAGNRPLIVRDWDPFSSTAPDGKAGIGRWGLFMEPFAMVLGFPASDVGYRWMEVARYNPDGSREKLFGVANDGMTTVKAVTITGGADLAEPFAMTDGQIPKGSVVVIDDEHPGRLKLSGQPYDHRVAGIVSGANGVNPGIALRQEGALEGGQNVALSGRVYALADSAGSPIRPGDLLTTSATPGHAMKATDPAKRQGAILGKAMTGLPDGRGMVLVLVTLQ